MRVEISAVPELECVSAVSAARGVHVVPAFCTPKGQANVASITVVSDGGRTLFRGMLKVSGANGKPKISAVPLQHVRPAIDSGQ